jgi:hypothetical protein
MGLTFQVGSAEQVLTLACASSVAQCLAELFPGCGVEPSDRELWFSLELGWSGWASLQSRVEAVLGPGGAPHLLSMEAWMGAYLPVDLEPGTVAIEGTDTSLDLASLRALVLELERFGSASGLAIDPDGLLSLVEKYDSDELCDNDMDLQTYAQLLQGAKIALERMQPLWVVK